MNQAEAPSAVDDGSGAGTVGDTHGATCWCCGGQYPAERLVHLQSHPEAAVCLRCAHFLHQQARGREDAIRPSIASRLRDGFRWGRRVVMDHGWQQRPIIGPPLRWLGQRLP